MEGRQRGRGEEGQRGGGTEGESRWTRVEQGSMLKEKTRDSRIEQCTLYLIATVNNGALYRAIHCQITPKAWHKAHT